jgi:hypothetical protein
MIRRDRLRRLRNTAHPSPVASIVALPTQGVLLLLCTTTVTIDSPLKTAVQEVEGGGGLGKKQPSGGYCTTDGFPFRPCNPRRSPLA